MNGYLDAIDDRQGCEIVLRGQSVYVSRARLGLHLQLARVAENFDNVPDARRKAHYLCEYFDLCGLSIQDASAIELVEAFTLLRFLNSWKMDVRWLMKAESGFGGPLPIYHYEQRWWATWIHEIASRYGWSRDEILNLWPEEAALYLQEIQLAEFNEREDQRALSEVSYEYNKVTKMSKFRPTPRPSWMIDEKPPEPIKTNRSMLPVGVVIPMQ